MAAPRIIGLALGVAVVAGCGPTVGGSAVSPQIDLREALPSADQVDRAVGNPLDPTALPLVGGIDLLPNGIRDSAQVSPLDCLGAATPLMRVVYERGDVHQVALQDFARYGAGMTVSSVHTGVVRFGSEAEAGRMFDEFVAQWRSCARTRVSVQITESSALEWTVTDVRENDRILSATILSADAGESAFPTEHALGLAADCIVEADVAVTDAVPTRREATGRAAELVAMMRDNVTRGR